MAKSLDKKPIIKAQFTSKKKPITKIDPDAYNERKPVWSFLRLDYGHEKWSLCQCNWSFRDLFMKLKDFEGMTWRQIKEQIGGRNEETNNHFVQVSDICGEAKKRLNELSITEEVLFSLRLSGKTRIFGILQAGIFYVIWWDPKHEIYPNNKKHT